MPKVKEMRLASSLAIDTNLKSLTFLRMELLKAQVILTKG